MTKLSATQKEIEELAKRVPILTDKQTDWAKRQFTYYVLTRQGQAEVRCPDCGAKFNYMSAERTKGFKAHKTDVTCKCPCCGASIRVDVLSDSACRDKRGVPRMQNHQEDFFQVMNVVGGWQVTRLIYMQRYCYVRKPSTDWEFYEVCQAWNRPDKTTTYFRSFTKKMMSNWYFQPYSLWDWQLRRDEEGNYLRDADGNYITDYFPRELEPRRPGSDNYFDTNAVAPNASVLAGYKRRGVTIGAIRALGKTNSAMWLFQRMVERDKNTSMYETLLKTKDYGLLGRITNSWRVRSLEPIFSAWKVCQRNHYTQYKKHLTEWLDMVDMLVTEHLDYHNAHYVCPTDLLAFHDELVARREMRLEREREIAEEKRMREMMKKNKHLVEERASKFGDLSISNGTLHSVVLITYDDYKTEGKKMHHCVGGYFDKASSLILSFRDSEEKRVETVEIDLKAFKIIQSRGVCNSRTEHHDEIIDLVNANMALVRKSAKKARKVA